MRYPRRTDILREFSFEGDTLAVDAAAFDALLAPRQVGGQRFADLDGVDCRFRDCVFEAVCFTGGDFTAAVFQSCRFIRCRFVHAKWRDAVFADCAFVDEVERTAGCVIAFSDLRAVRFERCDLSFCRIERSTLFEVEARGCNFRGATFHLVEFHHAYARNRLIHRAGFRDCNLELADLSGLVLREAVLSACRLREADFAGTDLTDADLRESDLFQAITTDAHMAGADLRGADISGLDLRRLAGFDGLKITPEQQYVLLEAAGITVCPDGT